MQVDGGKGEELPEEQHKAADNGGEDKWFHEMVEVRCAVKVQCLAKSASAKAGFAASFVTES